MLYDQLHSINIRQIYNYQQLYLSYINQPTDLGDSVEKKKNQPTNQAWERQIQHFPATNVS